MDFDVLSCLEEIINSAILIEKHIDKKMPRDTNLRQVYVMLSAYEKSGIITPVQLEIKEFVENENQLYLAVAIKKSGVDVTSSAEASNVTIPDNSIISIHELIQKINPDAIDFLKYIPDQFLSNEQLEGKQRGILRDIKKYPNSPFKEVS